MNAGQDRSREMKVAMFKVQKEMCRTCIFRKGLGWNLKALLNQVRDRYIGFKGYRICHHSKDACCRGFWDAYKDQFPAGQIAQRLNLVEFVTVDNMKQSHNPCCH